MINRRVLAIAISFATPEQKVALFREYRIDQSLVTTVRGSGNKSLRRRGEDFGSFSCRCDVCVVYGGDCASQMYQEARGEYHRSQRGVKTKGKI